MSFGEAEFEVPTGHQVKTASRQWEGNKSMEMQWVASGPYFALPRNPFNVLEC